ncbi:hypothetical protein ASZ90_010983 [hydrocarbon metagenome]|uniref:Bacterial Pleckstrin homology domain-containing protein n=1 Tax=hydrocarbon metagenome TaxID=938273 RepID=A0A0W8FF94_9ZZZZ|nr:hypothetical protein [Methanomicrobiaceae archaeon]
MDTTYHHTQIGYLTVAALCGGIALIWYLMLTVGFSWIATAVLAVLVLCLALFPTLTVEITDSFLEVRFGPGVIRKRFPLREIVRARAIRYPWYYGFGIRLTPKGWMYNVSGREAVMISLQNGSNFLIGTDAPGELEGAIATAARLPAA